MYMKRITACLVILSISISFSFSQEESYSLVEEDLASFLGFADEYREMASKFVKDAKTLTVDEIFNTDDMKLLTATQNLLQKKKWTYEKMIDFIYAVTMSLEALSYYETFGYPEEVDGENEEDPFSFLPRKNLELVKKYKSGLEKYFTVTNYEDIMGDYGDYIPDDEDYEAGEDYGDYGDYEDYEDYEDIEEYEDYEDIQDDSF
jgi:hypothetical protein